MADGPSVAVAGMGPVGMVAALALAGGGIPVTVFEKGPELPAESRASTFHPPTLEMLDDLGVAAELLSTGLQAPVFQQRDRRDGVLADLDLGVLAGETRFPFRLQSEQVNLTRIVLGRLEAMDHVDVRFSAPVERVETGSGHVVVHVGGDPQPHRFDWLVAADGTRSASRSSLGIAFEGITYPERFLVVSSEHDWRSTFPDLAYVSYIADPREWMVLLRTPRHWRALFPVPPDESSADAVEPRRVQERLQGIHPRSEPYPVLHTTIYNVHQRVASEFRRGRVLLAGDAAHINNPLGGMGMNSGIHDAVAAAKAILAAAGGAEPDAAAAAYATVRRRAALDYVQAETHQNFTALSQTDEEARKRRAAALAELVEDTEALRAHLRRTSMLASARRTAAVLDATLRAAARRRASSRMTRALGSGPLRAACCADAGEALRAARSGAGCVWVPAATNPAATNPAARRSAATRSAADPASVVREVAAAVDIPVVAEAGPGWAAGAGGAGLLVDALEHAGAAAVVIGDAGVAGAPETEEDMRLALAAALEARRHLLVVARTTLAEPAGARRRARLYAQWGADLVMADAALDDPAVEALGREAPTVMLAGWEAEDGAAPAGLSLVLQGAPQPIDERPGHDLAGHKEGVS